MPEAKNEKGDYYRAADGSDLPKLRLQHRDYEGREEKSDSGENRLRSFGVGSTIRFQENVDHPVTTRLNCDHSHAPGMNIIGVEYKAALLSSFFFSFGIVSEALLRVAQSPVCERQERE